MIVSINRMPEARTFPSMFEPIHGTGLDIAGNGIANRFGPFRTAAIMVDPLSEAEPARARMTAAEQPVTSVTTFAPDLGDTAKRGQVTDRVIAAVKKGTILDRGMHSFLDRCGSPAGACMAHASEPADID
ncbi:isocitrate/isopropylmalate family dehydrogenase [Rhodovibrio sodomensis]|nr:isocitrate/isopropylmalate family dehydrogenase [Rhodovibrio sodomensis]